MSQTSSETDGPDAEANAALLRSARAMVKDPLEADALVALTVSMARESQAKGAAASGANLYRFLRQAYHSIERSRPRRGNRESALASVGQTPAPAIADEVR